jgi:hypothetical protein
LQASALQFHVNCIINQALLASSDHGGTGTCTTSQGFAGTALKNTHSHVAAIDDLHKTSIDPLWELRV